MRFKTLRSLVVAAALGFIPSSTSEYLLSAKPAQLREFGWYTPLSLSDPALEAERKASVGWQLRTGPERHVVDLVCLVPDLPTFLTAISEWDDSHFFPILIDDSDYTYKFLRAFHPARILQYRGPVATLPAEGVWNDALAAVGRAWVESSTKGNEIPSGDRVPRRFGPTPPGVVVSAPGSPTLAGAVALAAGRFQPLLRWEPEKHYDDLLSEYEARGLASDLEGRIANRVPKTGRLGDDCDFITLAGDWPYRYGTLEDIEAFDDLLGRSEITGRRHAYAGRLIGSPAASVYQAMCSLFLQPRSAFLFNAYDESLYIWGSYSMRPASDRLAKLLDVSHSTGVGQAGIEGWHRILDPINRFDLVLINSSGSPTDFMVRGGRAYVADIPASGPTIVVQNHSHSAADPTDADTIAGRWLAEGRAVVHIYFGALYEPYLQSFRTPTLVAELMADHLPLSAAVRQTRAERFGFPWRLWYIGDPLYRLKSREEIAPRQSSWTAIQNWRTIELPNPRSLPASAPDDAKLDWAIETALASFAGSASAAIRETLPELLLTIHRERLSASQLLRYDGLIAELLERDDRTSALRAKLEQLPSGGLSPLLRRRLENARVVDLHRALATRDLEAASRLWELLIRSGPGPSLTAELTGRISRLADTPDRLQVWRDRLRQTFQAVRNEPAALVLEKELQRVEKELGL